MESRDGTAMGWILEYCEWHGWTGPKPVNRLVELKPTDDGKFVGLLDLPAHRTWRFTCTITADHAVTIGLDPGGEILWPRDGEWPIGASGPEAVVIYFTTGDDE